MLQYNSRKVQLWLFTQSLFIHATDGFIVHTVTEMIAAALHRPEYIYWCNSTTVYILKLKHNICTHKIAVTNSCIIELVFRLESFAKDYFM